MLNLIRPGKGVSLVLHLYMDVYCTQWKWKNILCVFNQCTEYDKHAQINQFIRVSDDNWGQDRC